MLFFPVSELIRKNNRPDRGDLMLLAIIAAAACLAATTIMYSPKMRSFRYYRPVALFFLFEGIWILADYAFEQFFPGNVFMLVIHYIGVILIILYFVLSMLLFSRKNKKSNKPTIKHSEK